MRESRTPAALAMTMALYSIAVIAFIGLAPFRFRIPENMDVSWTTTPFDLITNAVLFLVPGFLYRLSRRGDALFAELQAFVLGFAVSFLVEIGQFFLDGRVTSPTDVLTNAAGAWAGAVLASFAKRKLNESLADRLALELPLMGLFYLLVPLLWLHSLTGLGGTTSVAAALLLGLFGATIVSAVWVHRMRPAGRPSADAVSVLTGIWFLVASFPAFPLRPRIVLASAALVAFSVRAQTWWTGLHATPDRRFERPTIRRAAPLFLAYLAVLEVQTWIGSPHSWRGGLGISEFGGLPGVEPVLRVLTWLAAFVVLGYMIAEHGGRRDESRIRALLRVLLPALVLAALVELSRGLHPRYAASALRGCLSIVAAALGAGLYSTQLTTVRNWLLRNKA